MRTFDDIAPIGNLAITCAFGATMLGSNLGGDNFALPSCIAGALLGIWGGIDMMLREEKARKKQNKSTAKNES